MSKILSITKRIIPKKLFRLLQPYYHYAIAFLAALWYFHPSGKLIVIGVTGTTGKTTCVYLIAKALEEAGYKVGYTSTAMFNDGKMEWLNDKKMTMVGRFFSQKMLKRMVENGCQYAIIETTSEGVVQFRHKFINYDILVFTSLYPEHIDSHGNFENYKTAKGGLFEHLKTCKTKYVDDDKRVVRADTDIKKLDLSRVKKTIIVNLDDEHSGYFLDFWAERKIGFTRNGSMVKDGSDLEIIRYGDINASQFGTEYRLFSGGLGKQKDEAGRLEVSLQLLGEFNATNSMTAFAVGFSEGIAPEPLIRGLRNVTGIPGRLERIDEGQDFTVIVDYAFEPKAVLKLYGVVNVLPHNNIIHVLGSTGGGRDVARRPKLGDIAGRYADYVIVTNEDPYDDDPEIIMDQVSLGAENSGKKIDKNLFKILDRREAIIKALNLAKKNDIVLVTGKGSEQAICVANGEKIPWDDRAVIRGILSNSEEGAGF